MIPRTDAFARVFRRKTPLAIRRHRRKRAPSWWKPVGNILPSFAAIRVVCLAAKWAVFISPVCKANPRESFAEVNLACGGAGDGPQPRLPITLGCGRGF